MTATRGRPPKPKEFTEPTIGEMIEDVNLALQQATYVLLEATARLHILRARYTGAYVEGQASLTVSTRTWF